MAYSKRKQKAPKRRSPKAKASKPKSNASDLAFYLNPFSSSTKNPRIPDGKASHSVGITYNSIYNIHSSGTVFVLPFLNFAGCSFQNIGPDHFVNWPKGVFEYFVGAPYAPLQASAAYPNSQIVNEGDALNDFIVCATPANDCEGWRYVSNAVKITQAGNTKTTSGRYKAVRFLPQAGTLYTRDLDESPVKIAFKTPSASLIENMPSYCSGDLKDVHKKTFMLATEEDNHTFMKIFSNQQIDTEEALIAKDPSMDAIMIQISNIANQPVKIHHRFMIELLYTPRGIMAYQQSKKPTPFSQASWKRLLNKKRKLTKLAAT